MTFKELGIIDPILRAVEKEGYKTPTPIQQQQQPYTTTTNAVKYVPGGLAPLAGASLSYNNKAVRPSVCLYVGCPTNQIQYSYFTRLNPSILIGTAGRQESCDWLAGHD